MKYQIFDERGVLAHEVGDRQTDPAKQFRGTSVAINQKVSMDDKTKKTTVEETPGEKKTTEETHKPAQPARVDTTVTHQPGQPARDEKKTTVEKK